MTEDTKVTVRFCVPSLGSKIDPAGPALGLSLHWEDRNGTVLEALCPEEFKKDPDDPGEGKFWRYWRACQANDGKTIKVKLPAGTVLTIDRIYVRKEHPEVRLLFVRQCWRTHYRGLT